MPSHHHLLRLCHVAALLLFTAPPLAPALAPALAQGAAAGTLPGLVLSGVEYVDAAALALTLGDVVTANGGILTWRGAEGVVTFFAGSADALLQRPGDGGADDWSLSAPVETGVAEFRAGSEAPTGAGPAVVPGAAAGWALPLDAVQLLGVAFELTPGGVLLHGPSGQDLRLVMLEAGGADAGSQAQGGNVEQGVVGGGSAELAGLAAVDSRWEMTEIAGAPALRFFAPPGKSLLLLDLDLAPLAFPEATAAVDAAVAKAGSDHALLLVVSALSPQPWSSSLMFEQDGRSLEVRHPYRLRVYQGEPDSVGPGESVAAIVLLPSSFSLYRPLSVTWEAIDATVTFRR